MAKKSKHLLEILQDNGVLPKKLKVNDGEPDLLALWDKIVFLTVTTNKSGYLLHGEADSPYTCGLSSRQLAFLLPLFDFSHWSYHPRTGHPTGYYTRKDKTELLQLTLDLNPVLKTPTLFPDSE